MATSSSSSRRMRTFKRWMMSQGIDCSDALLLRVTDDGDCGAVSVRAVCQLNEGDLVATIPKDSCLTVRTSGARDLIDEHGLEGYLALSVALMYELSLGPHSPWFGYLQLLPQSGEPIPLLWSLHDIDSLLSGTELHKTIKEDKALVYQDWKECILPLLDSASTKLNPSFFGVEHYFAAKSLIASRSFQIDDHHGFGMVPLADLFNHKTDAEDVHFTSVSSQFENCNDSCDSVKDETSNDDSADPFNQNFHSQKSHSGGSDVSSTFVDNSAVLEMIMVKDVKPGAEEDSALQHQQKGNQLKKRIVFGLGIGISTGGVVLAGGWIFSVAVAAAIFVAAREYFELVRSRGIAAGMTPPPRYVSRVCSVICALMPILTLYVGQIDVSVTSAAFVVAMALLLQRGNPRFAQLSSAMFGLFYCGYLPCFWVKLRCALAVPALNTSIGAAWPVFLGGQAQWTVGLVATLISVSSIIAADTFAFVGGKAFGRTPLTSVSPKKTWEGAIAGLVGCITTSVLLSRVLCWPTSILSATVLGFLNFFGSLFGDLVESMIKRDAGVKDSGSLIPGHGGILDRVDSYIFTGALAYSFVKNLRPLYGV